MSGGYWVNYEEKYPEDAYFEEMADNARVWRTINDETEREDAERVASWNGTLDTLFLFVSEY